MPFLPYRRVFDLQVHRERCLGFRQTTFAIRCLVMSLTPALFDLELGLHTIHVRSLRMNLTPQQNRV